MTAGQAAPSVVPLPVRRVLRFAGHAVEMVVAMVLGMAVLGLPVTVAAGALGVGDLYHEQPLLGAVVMTVTMTLPMALWMVVRGHDGRMIVEMAVAMAIPVAALVAASLLGVIDRDSIMAWVDGLMYAAMVLAMVARWDHYSGGHDQAGHAGHGSSHRAAAA